MAIATILNALTATTKTHTVLEFTTLRGELFLHYGGMEPGALRIVLSPVLTRLRQLNPAWREAQAAGLDTLRATGRLSDEEFHEAKSRLT